MPASLAAALPPYGKTMMHPPTPGAAESATVSSVMSRDTFQLRRAGPRFRLVLAIFVCLIAARASAASFRPPSVPLVACDPYFSIWSSADKLTDSGTVHWTGKPHRLTSLVRIDGAAHRIMGNQPENVPAMTQTELVVLPTRTVYTFQSSGVRLKLTFLTPALPEDLDILARPVTYLTYEVQAVDNKTHDVQLYLDASGELAVNTSDQQVVGALQQHGELVAAKIGSQDQPVLAKKGDDIRIDWGYLYLAALRSDATAWALANRESLQRRFVQRGTASLTGQTTDFPAHPKKVALVIISLNSFRRDPE